MVNEVMAEYHVAKNSFATWRFMTNFKKRLLNRLNIVHVARVSLPVYKKYPVEITAIGKLTTG